MFICKYCNRHRKSKNSLAQHEIRCPENKNRKNYWKPLKGRTAWNKGLTADTDSRVKANSISSAKAKRKPEARKRAAEITRNKFANEDYRKRFSKRMIEVVKENPDSYSKDNVCGRVGIIEYSGHKLKGKWELITAQWLDRLGILWESETNPVTYMWKNKERLYFPDFYLPELDSYIEVKGYQRDRDIKKWNSVKKDLYIIDKSVIHNLQNVLTIKDIPKYARVV